MFKRGEIVRFHYVWKRQADAGEETGRKVRPVCVTVHSEGNPGRLFLFPITSQPPAAGSLALAINQMECRRAGLNFPCWIILDEYNLVDLDKTYDFESTKPLGIVSPAFLAEIARIIKQAAATGRLSGVRRS